MELDFEKMQKEEADRQKEKSLGISDLLSFLDKIKSKINFDDLEKVTNLLGNIKEAEYKDILKRINGLVSHIPISRRAFLPDDSSDKIATSDFSIFSEDSIVFPEMEDRHKISSEFFKKLQHVVNIEKNSSTLNKRVAISIFNSIIYIHPFKDGNGRTARLSYFLLNPDINKEKKNDSLNIRKILEERPESIEEYHNQLNLYNFATMLEKRGLPIDDYEEGVPYEYKYKTKTLNSGFDEMHLKFLAAYDVMDNEERKKFNRGTQKCEMIFNLKEFDENLNERYLNKLNDVRKEFTETVLDFSLNKDGQIKVEWLQEYLDKAVSK